MSANASLRPPPIPGGGPQTAAEVLDRALAEDPQREALVGRSGRFSFHGLDAAADRAAAAFAERGIGPGDRVAVSLPNDVDLVIAFLGAMRRGAIWVGVNRVLAPPEKRFLLQDAGASLLLATEEIAAEAGSCPRLSLERWRSLVAAAEGAARPDLAIDPAGPAAIAYTSGTTGRPKGAVHSHRNLLLPGAVSRARAVHPPEIRHGVVLPLTILNLVVLGPLAAWQLGSCCVAIDRIDPVGLSGWVREERVGTFAGVPTILHDLLTHPDVKPADLASLVSPMVGGAECPEEFRDLYRERFGREVGIGYGMTEAPTAVTVAEGEPSPRPGLCGVALPQVEIEIRGEDDRPLPPGEVGEICVRPARSGPWAGVYTPMLGYWNQPEATREALRGGAYHTGDLGFLEADGTLFIRGRRSELILRGGANVYPAEVERALLEEPRVAGCAVFGLADDRLGERVVAAVELEPGAQARPDELLAHCRERLARYKLPSELVVVEALPRNAMGKVIKRELAPHFEA